MRRLTTFIIITAICIVSSIVPVFAKSNDYQDRAVSFLAGMDILRGDESGNYLLDKPVNRAEFTAFVIRVLDLENLNMQSEQTFVDVPDTHWAKGVISTAANLKLIQGVGGRYFEPDRIVTLDEAIKIMVSALGYQTAAEQEGGYPTGYVQIASRLNLYKKLASSGGALDRANTCILLYNSLAAKVYNDTVGLTGKTMMEQYLDLTTINGKVTATVSYQGNTRIDADEIMLDNQVYICKDTYADEYIGCNVVCYIREESGKKVIYYIEGKDTINSVTVNAEDINPNTTLSRFEYYDGDKVKKLDLDNEITVFYNSEALAPAEITAATLKPAAGSITLRDGDDNGSYETIIIEVYDDYVVQYVAEDIVYDKFGGKLDLTDSKNTTILKGGESLLIENIQNGDVLSVIQSRDGERTKIYVSDRSYDGYINAIEDYGSEDTYILKEKETGELIKFQLNRAYKNALNNLHHDAVKLSISSDKLLRVYFNDFGLLADVSVLSQDDDYMYGYLMQTATTTNGLNTFGEFRVLTINNRYEIFKNKVDEKVLFGRKAGSKYLITKEDVSFVVRSLSGKQVVKFKLDEGGYLTEIYKADPIQSADHFSCGPENGTLLSYRDGVFNSKYYIDQNTAVFSVNNAYEYIMAAGKYTAFLSNGASKYCTFYDLEGSYAKVLLMTAPAVTVYEDNETTGYEVILDYVNSPIFYIDSITSVVGSDGNAYMCLNGFQDGESKKILVSNEIKPNSEPKSNLKPGIAIQYEDNGIYLERATTSDNLLQMVLFKTVYDFTAPISPDIFWEYEKIYSSRSQITTMWGSVNSANGEFCTLSVGDTEYTARVHDKSMVLRYDRIKNRFEQVTADEINSGQNVFIRQRYQNTREVVIY